MATSQMPPHLTKVSYILPKRDKPKLVRAAKNAGKSMSDVISQALEVAGILQRSKKAAKDVR